MKMVISLMYCCHSYFFILVHSNFNFLNTWQAKSNSRRYCAQYYILILQHCWHTYSTHTLQNVKVHQVFKGREGLRGRGGGGTQCHQLTAAQLSYPPPTWKQANHCHLALNPQRSPNPPPFPPTPAPFSPPSDVNDCSPLVHMIQIGLGAVPH